MSILILTNNYTFAIEQAINRRVRLIVSKDGEELVCRKESLTQFNDFLNVDEAKPFKGRLQLYKHHNDITVEVKGQPIGILHPADIKACLDALAN